MATTSQVYDHPTYTTRQTSVHTSTAGAAGVGCRFTAFTGMIAWSAIATVVAAGTATGNTAAAILQQISGTTTTTFGTFTLSTNAIGYIAGPLALSGSSGGVALLQGDRLVAVNGSDATSQFSLAWEVSVQPEANVTK